MMKRVRRFVDGAPYHICSKGINGFCIFYSFKDILVYITMYYVYAKVEGIVTDAFCVMINHTHSLVKVSKVDKLSAFVRNLESAFALEYNQYHKRTGQLFKRRFGGAPKPVIKLFISCLIYIFNNPVAGRICEKAMSYRWNLMAYHNSSHPFSTKLDKSKCSHKLACALKFVDYNWSRNQYLNYTVIEDIFDGLSKEETQQLIDYIVFKYLVIDFGSLENNFNGMNNALTAIEATYGSEYDIKEDWEDFGKYELMRMRIQKLGYQQNVNFETCPKEEIRQLYDILKRETDAPSLQIRKFLHIQSNIR